MKRLLRGAPPPPPPAKQATPTELDERLLRPKSPFDCTEFEIQRWNKEWLHYLGREWQVQLRPHTDYPNTPPLPEAPGEVLRHDLGNRPRLEVWARGSAIQGKRVLELGCGCGNLGKLLGRYVDEYVGLDFSPMALSIARLVSPSQCTYIQVADRQELKHYFGTIDTVVGRHFWIHQNQELAEHNLRYLSHFLKPDGRLFADFYCPDPNQQQYTVLGPDQPLSNKPSVVFHYSRDQIEDLVGSQGFKIVAEEIHPGMQRRFVELARLSAG